MASTEPIYREIETITDEDIEQFGYRDGKITVLSRNGNMGYERNFSIDKETGEPIREVETYKLPGKLDDALGYATLALFVPSFVAGLVINPWFFVGLSPAPVYLAHSVPKYFFEKSVYEGKLRELEEFNVSRRQEIIRQAKEIPIAKQGLSESEERMGTALLSSLSNF